MNVKVRDIVLGNGDVKICVPIMGSNIVSLKDEINRLNRSDLDLVEWRVDYYDDLSAAITDASTVRELLGNIPLLLTLRTKKEGGNVDISDKAYVDFYTSMIHTDTIDLIDIEAYREKKIVKELVSFSHANHVKVILSNHDFHKTPACEEILKRLRYMEEMDGDILKVAYMPSDKEDVITLLSATKTASESITRPLITMSMGPLGVVSRVCGETFGSCLSFGCAEKSSAPGQIRANDLRRILDILHHDQAMLK